MGATANVKVKTSGQDYSRLKTTIANSKTQATNNSLFQTVTGLISAAETFQQFINSSFSSFTNGFKSIDDSLTGIYDALGKIIIELAVLESKAINILEVDTTGGPITLTLEDIVIGYTIVKDSTGTASTNNITLTGTIDGIENPVIDSDYGLIAVYKSVDLDAFLTWQSNLSGSGGTTDIVDHISDVIAARATYVSGGGTFATNLSISDIPIAVATALSGVDGAGLLEKTSGDNIAAYGATFISISRVCYPSGEIFKILGDAGVGGTNTAQWVFEGRVNPSRYIAI